MSSSINESIESAIPAAAAAPPAAELIDHQKQQTTDLAIDDRAATEGDLLKFDDEEQVEKAPQPPESVPEVQEFDAETAKVKKVAAAAAVPRQLQVVAMELPKLTANYSSNSLVEVPLHESSDEELNDIEDGGMGRDLEDDEVDEGEHADHLSPLMMDNHTVVEHLECFSTSPTNEVAGEPAPVMIADSAGNITIMRHSDTKDSLSSLDSDLGMSFDSHCRQPATSTDDSQGRDSSSDNDPARDSGCETGPCNPARPYCPVEADEGVVAHGDDDDLNDESRPFEIPNEEFSERIVEQVEFYFSDDSILKDAFLLKHVRRNKEGFVSLKLVSSFKRVRQMTKDWRVVGHAIQLKSKTVELNDVGTKVRRIDPLPNHDETMPSRTVVATDLATDKITIEKAYEMFSKCGEIALVRILRVGGPIPADVRQFINKYPELMQKECALVEFVESRSARNALAFEGITVLEMVAPKKKTGKKAIVTRMVDSHPHPSFTMFSGASNSSMDQERSRGGAPLDNSTPPRFQIRRAASGYYAKPDQVMYVPPPRKFGYSHGNSFTFNSPAAAAAPAPVSQGYNIVHHQPNHSYQYQPQQPANNHHNQHLIGQQQQPHHHHHHTPQHYIAPQSPPQCDTYEVYRRTSAGHIVAVTSSPTNKFNPAAVPEVRRGSLPVNSEMGPRKMHAQQPIAVASPQPVYECQCSCQTSQSAATQHRRQPSLNGNELMFRRMSTTSSQSGIESPRKLSTGGAFERKVSLTETNWRNEAAPPASVERKYSNDHHTTTTVQYHQPPPESPIRKYSNGFDPLRKLSMSSDEYVNGRRISTDSGYDRKYSFSSDCSNARSRSNSFICNHAPVIEQIIRAPQGPAGDGSRGFGNRTRKIGQILPPI